MFDLLLSKMNGGVTVIEKSTLKDEKKFLVPRYYIAIDLKSFYASV